MLFGDSEARILLEAITRVYDKHLGQTEFSGETSGRGDEQGLDLDKLLEKDLLLAQTENDGDVGVEALVASRTLITAAVMEWPYPR